MAKPAAPAETLPLTPAAVSVLVESGHYVFRIGGTQAIYSYDKDIQGHSACTGPCLALWHPVAAPYAAVTVGDWTAVDRPEKYKQWAYKGKPVYTYGMDTGGQVTGDGVDGLWHVVKP